MLIAFFGGAMVSLPDNLQRLEVQGQSLEFQILEGVVVGEKSWSRTTASQAVGGSAQFRSTLTQEIWVRTADAREYPFKLIDQRLSVREGNEVTILLGSTKTLSAYPLTVWNRTTRQTFTPALAVHNLVTSTKVSGGCLTLIAGAFLSWVAGGAVFLASQSKSKALVVAGAALALTVVKAASNRKARSAIRVAVEQRLAEIQQVV